jgi:hypothetical protein
MNRFAHSPLLPTRAGVRADASAEERPQKTMTQHRTSNMKSASSMACIGIALIALAACGSSSDPSNNQAPAVVPPGSDAAVAPSKTDSANTNPLGTGATITVHIDNTTGGVVALPDGATIDVPAGALPPGVDSISVTSAPEPAPAEYKALSPVYVFGPDGTVFLKPLTVSIPLTVNGAWTIEELTMLWSRSRGDGFDMLPTQFVPGPASDSSFLGSAQVRHFSSGFCGPKFTTDPHPVTDPYAGK